MGLEQNLAEDLGRHASVEFMPDLVQPGTIIRHVSDSEWTRAP